MANLLLLLSIVRVRLLLSKGHSCYRPRRTGERKRKSVRGCIVDANMSVLALIVVRKGEKEIEGLTDVQVPRRLGPKRASKIRKLYNLSKEDDVRRYVVKRPLPKKEGKKQRFAAPKIQRLVTPNVLQVRFTLARYINPIHISTDLYSLFPINSANVIVWQSPRSVRPTPRSRLPTTPSCWLSARRSPRSSARKPSVVVRRRCANRGTHSPAIRSEKVCDQSLWRICGHSRMTGTQTTSRRE